MALQVPEPPEQGVGIIREALSSAINQPNVAAFAVAEAEPDKLATAAPHKVYFVGLTDLAEGRLLSAAQLKGWRYLIFEQDRPVVAAELQTDADEALHFSNVNRGPYVAGTVEGVNFAESLDIVNNEDFELRVLEISSLYLVALWLYGQRDLLIPLKPAPEELEPLRVYEENEIIDRLRGAAQNRLKFDNSPKR
jgi:hypothetical protein